MASFEAYNHLFWQQFPAQAKGPVSVNYVLKLP
jgi:hypothetical protein